MAWFNAPPVPAPQQQMSFRPQLGMGGTRVPAPAMPQSPQGQYAVKSAMASMQAQQRPPTDRFGNRGMASMTQNKNLGQLAMGAPDQGGVTPGVRQMPPPMEMSQDEREKMGAGFGPQNAALAGYMIG